MTWVTHYSPPPPSPDTGPEVSIPEHVHRIREAIGQTPERRGSSSFMQEGVATFTGRHWPSAPSVNDRFPSEPAFFGRRFPVQMLDVLESIGAAALASQTRLPDDGIRREILDYLRAVVTQVEGRSQLQVLDDEVSPLLIHYVGLDGMSLSGIVTGYSQMAVGLRIVCGGIFRGPPSPDNPLHQLWCLRAREVCNLYYARKEALGSRLEDVPTWTYGMELVAERSFNLTHYTNQDKRYWWRSEDRLFVRKVLSKELTTGQTLQYWPPWEQVGTQRIVSGCPRRTTGGDPFWSEFFTSLNPQHAINATPNAQALREIVSRRYLRAAELLTRHPTAPTVVNNVIPEMNFWPSDREFRNFARLLGLPDYETEMLSAARLTHAHRVLLANTLEYAELEWSTCEGWTQQAEEGAQGLAAANGLLGGLDGWGVIGREIREYFRAKYVVTTPSMRRYSTLHKRCVRFLTHHTDPNPLALASGRPVRLEPIGMGSTIYDRRRARTLEIEDGEPVDPNPTSEPRRRRSRIRREYTGDVVAEVLGVPGPPPSSNAPQPRASAQHNGDTIIGRNGETIDNKPVRGDEENWS